MPSTESDIVSVHSDIDLALIDHDDVSNYNPEQILPESPEAIQKIRSWLQPTAYAIAGGEYRKHLASHVAGTGGWVTSSATYQQWLTGSENGLLWIKGIPGSGKSVVAANVIHEIAKSNPGSPVLFFFFRQIIDANHQPRALLQDWLDQVLEYSPPLQKQLRECVEDGQSLERMSIKEMWKLLRMAFSGLPGNVFCVVDALDEMDRGHDAFLEALGALGQWQPEKVKVLMTSRPVPSVEWPLRQFPCLHIRLQESLVDVDIATYVQFALSNSDIPQSDWQVIADAVPGQANGLFIYAKLAMDAFVQPGADINTVISQLPVDLNALYTGLLREHAERSGVPEPIQLLILQAVTHATRPLRLLELAEMVKVNSPDGSTRDLKATKDLIRSACGPLLEILADETVSVIHHSFTEHLKGTTRSDDAGDPCLQMGPTHAQLALACLHYLQAGCLDDVKVTIKENSYESIPNQYDGYPLGVDPDVQSKVQLRLKYPFLEYSGNNWHHHVNRSEANGHDQTEVNMALRKFIGNDKNMKAWLQVKWPCGLVSQLHIAARKGLVSYAKELIRTEPVDVPDASGKTPLWWAADGGHSEIIRALIAAGANPDHDDEAYGLKPLHLVARSNHHEAAKVLLEAGVDPLAKKTREGRGKSVFSCSSTIGETALMYACLEGHLETVEAFLPFLQSIDSVYEALYWAAAKGHARVVVKILEYPGLDVNVRVHGNTTLYAACSSWDVATVAAILKAGADPNITCAGNGWDWTPWMGDGDKLNCLLPLRETFSGKDAEPDKVKHIFSLLVDAGIDINHRTKHDRTPLHYAVDSPILMRLLLDAGADANATGPLGSTPLHEVRTLDCMMLLVEQGNANIDHARADGRTPLLCLLSSANTEMILKFLEYGPDCNQLDNKGNGVLHVLLGDLDSRLPIIKALLKGGADPNLKNQDGLTPLLCLNTSMRGFREVVDPLLEAGADINAANRDGVSFLQQRISSAPSLWEDVEKEIRYLIDRGASTSIRDGHGRTCLHHAILSKGVLEPTVAKFNSLVDLGFDVRAVDDRGNGLLHELALRGKTGRHHHGKETIALWKRLLDLGLDVELKNKTGRTPLHVLCAAHIPMKFYEWPSILAIDILIAQVKDIDVVDKDGITALHVAATGGELYVKKLLDAGADPTAATNEGLTPLHIAARCRESNIVGLLLDALRKRNEKVQAVDNLSLLRAGSSNEATSSKPVIGVNAKAASSEGDITPLFYACRSGRPESVALLLEAGADVNIGAIFRAFDGFDEEDGLWKSSADFIDDDGNGGAIALKMDDRLRHKAAPPDSRPYLFVANQTTRPDEIFGMLVEYGADESRFNADSITASDGPMGTFCKFRDPTVKEASIHTVDELEIMKPGMDGVFFRRFLSHWEFHLVEQLARLGVSFLPIPDHDENCKLAVLVHHGFAPLVEAIGTIEADRSLEQGDWHAFGDATQPGLFFAGRDLSNPRHVGRNTMPFLLHAIRRQLPNMAVVRLLVDKFGVDINELHHTQEFLYGTFPVCASDSALHSVAEGECWWHVHQALPYLLNAGADVGIRNYKGQTPLHLALGARSHQYGDVAVRMLIAAGADVCAVDNEGKSCLAYARNHVDMVRLLRFHGATVTADAVLGAVESKNVNLLKEFLSGGTSANMRLLRPLKEPFGNNRDPGSETESLEPHRVSPLYQAGLGLRRHSNPTLKHHAELATTIELVQVLIDHGADPFAEFLQNGKERTVLHELLRQGRMIDQFLDIPQLDVNHRDAQGRTLLHAAFQNCHDLDHILGLHKEYVDERDPVTVFQRLVSLGADVEARDDFGRNVLHYMVGIAHDNNKGHDFEKGFSSVLHKAPSIIDQADGDGMTPLHYAVNQAVGSHDSRAALLLLSSGADHLAVTKTGDTVLHLLCQSLEPVTLRQLFQDLVQRGVDVNARNHRGETPLFAFCSRPKLPRSYSPSIWSTDSDEASEKYTEDGVGRMLETLGADFSARDAQGRGLMHVAASGDVGRFKELMDMGLDAMLEDDAQQTAIDVAAASGNRDVLELFEKKD